MRQRPPAYFRDNYHTLEGLLLARGPDIAARGDAGTLDVLDFAPSCLALLGEPARADLGGRVAAFVRG